MKILVTGATGLIGQMLCQRLAEQNHHIVFLSRRPVTAKPVPGASAFRWDPLADSPPAEAWESVEAVIHLAGEPIAAARWTPEQKQRIRDSRVTGTQNLVDGIRKLTSRPRVLISGSAIGFYGDRGDELLTENSSHGQGFLSEVCQEWEREALRARELGLRVVTPRIGVVLDSAGGALEKMLLPFKLGLGGRLGSGRQWFPWIHLDDIVGIFLHALDTLSLEGPVNGAAPGIVTNEAFTKEFAAALHRPVFLPVPELVLRVLMGEMADVVLSSARVIPTVAQETGYQFRYPQLRPALDAVLKEG